MLNEFVAEAKNRACAICEKGAFLFFGLLEITFN